MDLPLAFGFHPHVQQDGSGDRPLHLFRAPHDVAVDKGIRPTRMKTPGGGDERQRGRVVNAPRFEVGEGRAAAMESYTTSEHASRLQQAWNQWIKARV